jgi:DNA repair exonuclease SbcCD ATPase subunit
MQNDILSQDVIDNFNQRYNELNDELTRLKEIDRDYDKIVGIVNEENDMKNEFESFLNSIDEKKIKSSLEHFKSIQSKHNKLAEKINNFQNGFLPKISKYNEFIRQNEILKKEIFDIYEKFKENQLQVNETLDKLMSKIREMFDETNKLKFMPIINKSKNEMKVIWEKIEEIYANIINKLKSFAEKKGISMVRSDQPNIKNVQNRNINKEQIKQISDKINKDMIPLEEKQKEIIKIFDKLKADKSNCINNLYNLANEEEQILNEIKPVYNNDIKNINKENINNNFEKYKNFNEKYKAIFEKIKDASNKCATLVKSYNDFISTEYDNRKKIFDNINNFARNGIGLDEKNEKIIKKSEEILNGIKNYKINELNDIFNNNVNKKMKDLNRVQEILVALMSK